MNSRVLSLSSILALAAAVPAQTDCLCDYRFGAACNNYELSSRDPWTPGTTTALIAGPAPAGSASTFVVGARLPAPISLASRGYPGCFLHVQPFFTIPLGAATRFAALPLPVPNDPALVGISLAAQGLAVDPALTNPLLASNGWSFAFRTKAPSDPSPSFQGLAGLSFGCNGAQVPAPAPAEVFDEFVAYHTRLPATDRAADPSGATALRQISGQSADIVVNVPTLGLLEFGRGTSYLPRWVPITGGSAPQTFPQLPLVGPRNGDGDATRPDRLNRYAYARIVSADGSNIVVHRRYVPDHRDPTPTGWVHEIYTISSTGSVTRVSHESAGTMDGAAQPARNQQQSITLTASGMSAGAASTFARPLPTRTPGASAVLPNALTAALSLSLDDSTAVNDRTTIESVSGTQANVEGRLAHWHAGVSGRALAFDGYTSAVTVPAARTPQVNGSFTLSCWVSLAAYPFGTVQLAGQASPHGHDGYVAEEFTWGTYLADKTTGQRVNQPLTVGGIGYLLALDGFGRTVVAANIDGQWMSVSAPVNERLPLNQWIHLVASYDATTGEMRILQNDREVVNEDVAIGAVVNDPSLDFVIGRNKEPQYMTGAIEMHAEAFTRSIFGFEGLIDEVRLYNRVLSRPEATTSFAAGNPSAPVLPNRRLPTVANGTSFDAQSTTLPFHDLWDELFHDSGYDDVVVTFDLDPTRKIVFWKGMSYTPSWLTPHNGSGRTDDIWNHDQSIESADDDHGLCEHMADKEVRHAHVRVLERTAARVVVQYRYAVVSPANRLAAVANEVAWADEFYTIYPDGTAVRWVQDWFCNAQRPLAGKERLGWQGTYFLTPPGSSPRDMVDANIATVMAANGQVGLLSVENVTPPSQMLADPIVVFTNTRSTDRLFRGLPTGSPVTYYPELAQSWSAPAAPDPDEFSVAYSPYQTFNHYPVCQVPDDGRLALFADRISHSEGWVDIDIADRMLYGFASADDAGLRMTNFWNYPATVSNAATTTPGATVASLGYEPREHSYQFDAEITQLSFQLQAAPGRPRAGDGIQSFGVVVRNWDDFGPLPTVRVNGAVVAARTGVHYEQGIRTLVAWVPMSNQPSATVVID
ncbi:MAG: LamG-like jellyroll fold domain-containing protein [Planctomycetota bacterium]